MNSRGGHHEIRDFTIQTLGQKRSRVLRVDWINHWNWRGCYDICQANHGVECLVSMIAQNKHLKDHKHSNITKVETCVQLMSFCSVMCSLNANLLVFIGLALYSTSWWLSLLVLFIKAWSKLRPWPRNIRAQVVTNRTGGCGWHPMASHGIPGFRSGGRRKQDLGWTLVTKSETKSAGLFFSASPSYFRSMMSYFRGKIVFLLLYWANFPSWYLGCWMQPSVDLACGQAASIGTGNLTTVLGQLQLGIGIYWEMVTVNWSCKLAAVCLAYCIALVNICAIVQKEF